MCHEISPSTPGVAYVLPETGPPVRVRAAFAEDAQIREAAETFAAPRPRPVQVVEQVAAPGARRPRASRSNATNRTGQES